jgi:DNA-binding CsgD family transcriptional regulator
MATPEISTVLTEARAAVETCHRLLEQNRMLRSQFNQSLCAVRDSAATLALNLGAVPPPDGIAAPRPPVAGSVVLTLPAGPLETPRQARLPETNARGAQPLHPPVLPQFDPKDEMGLDLLTPREIEVLRLIGEGMRTKEIAFTLGITFKTAVTHRSNIMEKLGIHEGPRLVRFAIRTGIARA